MDTLKKVFESLALKEEEDNFEAVVEDLGGYEIPAHQIGGDVVGTEVVEPKEEEADFTSGVQE